MYCNKTLKQLKNEREKKMVSNKIAIVLNSLFYDMFKLIIPL